jgi:hypothetical protein
MQSAVLSGPYRLAFDDIHAIVNRKSAGAFVLGYIDKEGVFCIRSVGRSDDDVKSRLQDLIGSDQVFKYSYYRSAADAFLTECDLFHTFRPHGNGLHPERPRGSNLECPRCQPRLPDR